MIASAHWCESILAWLKVRELILALSKLLTIGVSINKRSWPRLWLISIMSKERDWLDLDKISILATSRSFAGDSREQLPAGYFDYYLYHVNEVWCLPVLLWEWMYKCVENKQRWFQYSLNFTNSAVLCFCFLFLSYFCSFCLIILMFTLLLWNVQTPLRLDPDRCCSNVCLMRHYVRKCFNIAFPHNLELQVESVHEIFNASSATMGHCWNL